MALHLGAGDLRRRWRSYLGVALLLGLVGGLSLFALAGARRTQSSYPRFLRVVRASNVWVTTATAYDPVVTARIAHLPDVVESRTFVAYQVNVLVHGQPDFTQDMEGTGTVDGRFYDEDRFTATSGRRPDPTKVDEVAVDELAAHRYGYHVGQRLELATYSIDQQDAAFYQHPTAPKLVTSARIVGVGLFPDEVLEDEGDRTPRLLLTPAFSREALPWATYGIQGLVLAHGDASADRIQAAVRRIQSPVDLPTGSAGAEYRRTSADELHALRALRPLSFVLVAFGAVGALIAFVLGGQGLVRVLRSGDGDRAIWRALGASPRQIVVASLVAPAIALVGGAVLAVGLAVGLSPLMPVGPVRRVLGGARFDVDVAVVAVGAVALVVVPLLLVTIAALAAAPHRLARRPLHVGRSSRVVALAAEAGMQPPAVSGLRFALEPGGTGRSSPTRSAMVGAGVALAALIGALTFGASLEHLVDHPRLYGWSGDAAIIAGNGYGNIAWADAHRVLDADRAVASWSGAWFGSATLDGVDTQLLGMAPGSALMPPVVRGRPLAHRDEVVLGAATADALHVDLGDTVAVAGERTVRLKVVGIASLPAIGEVHVAHPSLGTGALVAPQVIPGYDLDITGTQRGDFGPRTIFVRYRAGTVASVELAHLRGTTASLRGFAGLAVVPVQRPVEIANARSVRGLPTLLAGALALAALVSLGLALGGAAGRHRVDLAVLRALGCTGRQLSATMIWLASATIAVGVVVGLPLGIVAGRLSWRLFADPLDVVEHPVVPGLVLALAAVAAIALANVAALVPAGRARRVEAGATLRAP